MIWTDEYLDRLQIEAEEEISRETKCLIDRISLATLIDDTVFQLPEYVFDVRKVYWKGERLDPLPYLALPEVGYTIQIWHEGAFAHHAFTGAFNIGYYTMENSLGSLAHGGKPREYFYYGFGENRIYLNPPANEQLEHFDNGLWGTNIGNSLIVEYYRIADGVNWKLPEWFRRRTIKAYVSYKAFAQEGPGQNLNASEYHKNRYLMLLARARLLVENVYRAQSLVAPHDAVVDYPDSDHFGYRYNFDGDYGYQGPGNIARPSLPANYGITLED